MQNPCQHSALYNLKSYAELKNYPALSQDFLAIE